MRRGPRRTCCGARRAISGGDERLAIVADAEVTERARCVRAIASQTSVSALGVASWQELEVAMDGLPLVSLIVYAPPIAGAPDDAICMSGDAAPGAADRGFDQPGFRGRDRRSRPSMLSTNRSSAPGRRP